MSQLKIGIDVGGTFTHAVAMDLASFQLVGKACVPTTHSAQEGVAKGVVDSLQLLLKESDIDLKDIRLIAHSTTQATNALLEGDTAVVGIIGMGQGLEAWRAKSETRLDKIELSPGKFLQTRCHFVHTDKSNFEEAEIKGWIQNLVDQGAEVIVASEAFGVDHPEREEKVVAVARDMGLLATAASQISKLYGLKIRTRTAVINASMMPKMLETANMTEEALKKSGIDAPLMVMRSDGGIMDIHEMRRRPILTMLSGPAAGVAAALMYAKVSDGIFVEVGGTSSDISVIKNGKPQVKTAQIGGNRLYVQTLDVRTLGIAGGSVPRLKGNQLVDVGPRSAHIAGLGYAAYQKNADFSGAKIETFQPKKGDPDNYIKLVRGDEALAITPSEASHLLGLVKEQGHGAAEDASVKAAFELLASHCQRDAQTLAKELLTLSAKKIEATIEQLVREYKLDRDLIRFVGGGGGASAIVPFTSQHMNIPHMIAEHAEVISAIGAALGLIRDVVERNLINPTDQDILQLRQEAVSSVLQMGADPDSVEVSIEVDQKNKKVVAIATGSSDMAGGSKQKQEESSLKAIAAESLRVEPSALKVEASTEHFLVVQSELTQRYLGVFPVKRHPLRLLDTEGTVRLGLQDAETHTVALNELKSFLQGLIERKTSFGDAGGLLPDLYVLVGQRVVDLSGLMSVNQILALAEIETQNALDKHVVVLLQTKK